MTKKTKKKILLYFDKFSGKVTKATGSPAAFMIAFAVILIWAVSGPFFGFSDTWQLVINTGTTIVTFLMVFVIQQSQNKDTMALQLKLNELIAANRQASNRLVDIEDLTDDELQMLKKYYVKLADMAEQDNDLFSTHSLDEAGELHTIKLKSRRSRSRKSNANTREKSGSQSRQDPKK